MKIVKEQLEDIRELITDHDVALYHVDSGYTEGVELHTSNMKIYLWDDQNEQREWDENTNDYTPFKDLFISQLEKSIESLKNLKKQVSK